MNAYNKLMDIHGFVLGPMARDALAIVKENVSRADHVVDDIEWDRHSIML